MQETRRDNQPPAPRPRNRNVLRAWFDVRRSRLGSWAFALNRLTGLGLTLYLFIHLAVLYQLAQGPEAWNDFVALAKHPLYLLLDVVLLFGLLFHGLNGIRLTLVGMGIGAHKHRTLFWVLILTGLLLLVVSSYLVFTV